jgi:signal peptidase I
MDKNFFTVLFEDYPGYLAMGVFVVIIGAVGGAKLFAKAGKPWVAAFVPIWNVITVLKMVGRPASHIAFFLVPVYNIYFFFRLCIEIAQTYGKYSTTEYVLVCLLNVFYILNLALAYNEEYQGPVYGRDVKNVSENNPALV